MATRVAPDATLDVLLAKIATADTMLVCSGASSPTTRAAAVSAALASQAMTPGNGNGDYVIADDGSSGGGRKVTMSSKDSVPITVSGTASCVALVTSTDLIYVTTCTEQPLIADNTVNIPSWKVQVADPT